MRLPTSVVVLSLLVAVTLPLGAQTAGNVPSDSVRSTADTAQIASAAGETAGTAKGASLTGLRAGVHARGAAAMDRPVMAADANRNLGQSQAMMVVGLAALIAGAVIGGDAGTIIMIGGTVVGLVGLYEYLK
jgi:hypothetical protein